MKAKERLALLLILHKKREEEKAVTQSKSKKQTKVAVKMTNLKHAFRKLHKDFYALCFNLYCEGKDMERIRGTAHPASSYTQIMHPVPNIALSVYIPV